MSSYELCCKTVCCCDFDSQFIVLNLSSACWFWYSESSVKALWQSWGSIFLTALFSVSFAWRKYLKKGNFPFWHFYENNFWPPLNTYLFTQMGNTAWVQLNSLKADYLISKLPRIWQSDVFHCLFKQDQYTHTVILGYFYCHYIVTKSQLVNQFSNRPKLHWQSYDYGK